MPDERVDTPEEPRFTEDPLLLELELRVRTERDTSEFEEDVPRFVVTFDEDVPRFVDTFEERSMERVLVELLLKLFSRELDGLEFILSLDLADVEAPSPLNDVLRLVSLLRTDELLSEEERVDKLLPDDISDRDPDER